MAIANMDQLVAAMTAASAQNIAWNKSSQIAEAAGTFCDFSQTHGQPGFMATPDAASSGGTSYTGSAAGGLPFNAPAVGQTTYLLSFTATSNVPGNLYLTDRLWACRGLSVTLGATTNIVGMTDISRYSSGVGAEIWYWCIAGAAFTAGTMTVSYTNSDGVSGRSCTITIGTSSATPLTTSQCFVGSLQAGDKGVRSIQSVTNTSCSFGGTGANHGLFVAKRLLTVPIAGYSVGASVDGISTGLQEIDTNACLNFIVLASGVQTGFWQGNLHLVQG